MWSSCRAIIGIPNITLAMVSGGVRCVWHGYLLQIRQSSQSDWRVRVFRKKREHLTIGRGVTYCEYALFMAIILLTVADRLYIVCIVLGSYLG